MDQITFNCRRCKKKTTGKLVMEFDELLRPGLKVLECQEPKKNGICGILGVELIPDLPSDLRL
jgi:hypothetical protein